MNEKIYQTSRGERNSYGVYFLGQLFFYTLVMSFTQLFLTDRGIPAGIVGIIFIASKIWDAVNDVLFGVIVDKAHLKGGKYKPWLKLSTFLIPAATIFLFALPSGASLQAKVIWAAVGYNLWATSYTICDIPIFALATSMTSQLWERDKLYALNRFFCMLGALLITVFVPILYPNIGWTATGILISLLALAAMLPVNFLAKERVVQTSESTPTVRQLMSYLFGNKYLLIFNGAYILMAVTNTASAVQNYFAINNLGGPRWITLLALAMSLPTLEVALIIPKFILKLDKFKVYLGSMGANICFSVIMYFGGYENLGAFFTLVVLRAICMSVKTVILVMCTADCAEYGHY